MIDSFILGLSTGSACILTCGVVLFPYLTSDSAGTRKIVADVSVFLLTRLVVYLILATLDWFFGKIIFTSPVFRTYISGALYTLFSIMLLWYSISKTRTP